MGRKEALFEGQVIRVNLQNSGLQHPFIPVFVPALMMGQVWSLSQFCSVDFFTIKGHCERETESLFTNTQPKFTSAVETVSWDLRP